MLFGAVLFGVVSTTSVYASGGVGGRPANPDPDNPRTTSIFIYQLKGGQTKSDQIYLSNGSDAQETVEIYAVDGVAANTGVLTCEQQVESRDEVGKWIKLAKSEATLAPRGNELIDFTVTVPANADVGEHNGCIAIQRKGDEGATTGNVRVKTRQAVRVSVLVPGKIHREVTVDSFKAEAEFQKQKFEVVLKNKGNVSADVDIALRLKDVFGNEVYKNGGQYAAIPNQKLQLNFEGDFKPFFGGWYTASANIAYDKRPGVFGTPDKRELLYAQGKDITLFIWPSPVFLLLLGLGVVGGIWFVLWRKRQQGYAKKRARKSLKKSSNQIMWGPYTVKSGDTLTSLARKHKISVEKLAVLNKLSTSSKLQSGQRIYVPKRK
jgi:hypothetical protein